MKKLFIIILLLLFISQARSERKFTVTWCYMGKLISEPDCGYVRIFTDATQAYTFYNKIRLSGANRGPEINMKIEDNRTKKERQEDLYNGITF